MTARPDDGPRDGAAETPLAIADRLADVAHWVRRTRPSVRATIAKLIEIIAELVLP